MSRERPWTEEEKTKALAIAETLGSSEAAKATGIPVGTIRSWRHRLGLCNGNGNDAQRPPATQRSTQKFKELREEVMDKAIEDAGAYVRDRFKELADKLYGLAEDGVVEARNYLKKPGTKDRDSAAWLRAVVGAMHYGIQDGQLLSERPTARSEVTDRHEYDITQRIIIDDQFLGAIQDAVTRRAESGAPHRLAGFVAPGDDGGGALE